MVVIVVVAVCFQRVLLVMTGRELNRGNGALSSLLAVCVMWGHSPLSCFSFHLLNHKASSLSKWTSIFKFLSRRILPDAIFYPGLFIYTTYQHMDSNTLIYIILIQSIQFCSIHPRPFNQQRVYCVPGTVEGTRQ